jgi:deoxycytidine triphosphate deaminase
MSLIAYTELVELVDRGVIEGASQDAINSASIDIHLGQFILTEVHSLNDIKYLNKKSSLNMHKVDLGADGEYCLAPGEFILAQSREVFYLPNDISAEYKLKSSMARLGLDHLNAGWCDAGWRGSVLTLELKNQTQGHRIVIRSGDRIGQMIFYRHAQVPENKSYAARGTYNNDRTVSGVKITQGENL